MSDGYTSSIPLGELGQFVKADEDPVIYHKNLRDVEYVTGEMTGRLGAPIYGMFDVEDQLENYTTPDGQKISGMPMGLIGSPDTDRVSGFEWGGEWTVTYETFRDMGGAFMLALLLIYTLIVLEFKDYAVAGLIMSPIPLTLIGIIPGHLIMGAEFTATSMTGMIALGGIVVRVSILLVEFVKIEVDSGKDIREAVVNAAQTRLRPILITSLTLMAGAFAIISDPIFQGMAVSLLFGAGVATLFTLIVIPLGCISLEKRFVNPQTVPEAPSGSVGQTNTYATETIETTAATIAAPITAKVEKKSQTTKASKKTTVKKPKPTSKRKSAAPKVNKPKSAKTTVAKTKSQTTKIKSDDNNKKSKTTTTITTKAKKTSKKPPTKS